VDVTVNLYFSRHVHQSRPCTYICPQVGSIRQSGRVKIFVSYGGSVENSRSLFRLRRSILLVHVVFTKLYISEYKCNNAEDVNTVL